MPLLIEAIPPIGSSAKITQPYLTRSQLVRQAEEYMLAHLEEPITLKDLCQVLNTSSSPLNRGFQDVFGVSPMVYLRQLRLHAIHQILKAADPTTTQVADVAQRLGFWHGGRFSQYYQQMFGQPPSTTLKQ
ncbi:MAG: helix-turn-helix domain-containing protein [Leptolyngbyaceae cyanobacterium SM2_5_2]|nr:helix-turn-helix domain-containing protein [Leptolyngbyaceae cyanobacterium SM2_5_2]